MAGNFLVCYVLFQVLFITVCGESTKVAFDCPNQTVTVGEPLQLTCIVTCEDCKSTHDYDWSKVNNPDINCSDGQKREITRGKSHKFQCTIQSASEKHNGTFQFWAQMSKGQNKKTFSVTIVPRAADHITLGVFSKAGPSVTAEQNRHEKWEKESEENGRSYKISVGVAVISCFVIVTMVAVFSRRKKKVIMSISPLFPHKSNTGDEII